MISTVKITSCVNENASHTFKKKTKTCKYIWLIKHFYYHIQSLVFILRLCWNFVLAMQKTMYAWVHVHQRQQYLTVIFITSFQTEFASWMLQSDLQREWDQMQFSWCLGLNTPVNVMLKGHSSHMLKQFLSHALQFVCVGLWCKSRYIVTKVF